MALAGGGRRPLRGRRLGADAPFEAADAPAEADAPVEAAAAQAGEEGAARPAPAAAPSGGAADGHIYLYTERGPHA